MEIERQQQNIVVQVAKNFKEIDICLPGLEKLVKTVCKRFKLSRATVSVALLGDDEIRKLNKRFLNRDYATDCLSFDLSNGRGSQTQKSELGNLDECAKSFEVVVNAEMAVREAALRGHSSEAELALYITHCLLHNLGFDDSAPDEATKMHDTEHEIIQQLGYDLTEGS
ncbi:MAG: rRNA maturation RNase YbeY [Planctomycetota bacterium]|jgi:probable rRNA maturation factor